MHNQKVSSRSMLLSGKGQKNKTVKTHAGGCEKTQRRLASSGSLVTRIIDMKDSNFYGLRLKLAEVRCSACRASARCKSRARSRTHSSRAWNKSLMLQLMAQSPVGGNPSLPAVKYKFWPLLKTVGLLHCLLGRSNAERSCYAIYPETLARHGSGGLT